MSDLPTPINRHEQYLNAIANGITDNLPTPPITREEVFLDYIARNGGGGGGGDVTGVKGNAEGSYRRGNVNLTPENLGLGNVNNTSDANKPVSTAQQTALDSKVDKVIGKGLSENDYTDADKAIVDGVTSALAGKASTNDLGDKSNLTTTDKSSCVAAINEVNNNLKPSSVVLLQANSIPGITIAWENNEDKSHMAYRVGNLVIINISCFVTGTYSDESMWVNLFDMPSSLLKSGEQFMDSIPVSIIASTKNGNSFDNNRILRGRQMLLSQNQSIDFHFGYQIIVGVVSQ